MSESDTKKLPGPEKHWSERDARRVLAAHRREGGTLAAFCRRHGYRVERAYRWRWKLRAEKPVVVGSAAEENQVSFVPVRVVDRPRADAGDRRAEPETPGSVAVEVRGGRRIAVRGAFDATVLQRAVLALEALARC